LSARPTRSQSRADADLAGLLRDVEREHVWATIDAAQTMNVVKRLPAAPARREGS
jgi:hypothetical protein